MPRDTYRGGIRRNSSTPSLCSHGYKRDDSVDSLTSVEIPHNDSSSSLSSMAIDMSDEEDHRETSRSGHKCIHSTKTTPPQFLSRFSSISHDNTKEGEKMESSPELEDEVKITIETPSQEEGNDYSSCGDIDREWITSAKLAKALSDYSYSRTTLLQLYLNHGFNTKSVRAVVACNSRIFSINGETVDLRPQISMCFDHLSTDGCQDEPSCEGLHICPQYLAENCESHDCPLGHRGDTHHNSRVLTKFCLQTIPQESLRKIIEYAITYPRPEALDICEKYNETSCNKDKCKKLHICFDYIAGLANCSHYNCPLNHSFLEPSVSKHLETHGVSTKESPKDIVKALLRANPNLAKKLPESEDNEMFSSDTVWSTESVGDIEIPEICYNSVEGRCEHESKGCKRLHSLAYFHFQIHEPKGSWLNLIDYQVDILERAYCDPEKDCVTLPQLNQEVPSHFFDLMELLGNAPWQAHFETGTIGKLSLISEDKELELRRLPSEDIGESVSGRDYSWYYESENGDYKEFGTGEEDLSEVNSELIERMFQKMTGENSKIHFTTAKYSYYLDVNTMTLINEDNEIKQQVRRRPKPHMDSN